MGVFFYFLVFMFMKIFYYRISIKVFLISVVKNYIYFCIYLYENLFYYIFELYLFNEIVL